MARLFNICPANYSSIRHPVGSDIFFHKYIAKAVPPQGSASSNSQVINTLGQNECDPMSIYD